MASCAPERCDYCGATPCVGDDCPANWRCVSCGVNPSVPPHGECEECRLVTEREIRIDHDYFGDDYDPDDDESWMEDYP